MKIDATSFIQNRNIIDHSQTTFYATYKGKSIWVSSDHGLGKAKYDHLTRFNIEVTDLKTGLFDVNTYEDCHTMKDAIRVAINGAMLNKKEERP